MKKAIIFGILAIVSGIFLVSGLERSQELDNNLSEEIKNADEKALILLDACQKAETLEDFRLCFTGLSPVIHMCDSYPQLKTCHQADKIQNMMDRASEKFPELKP